ncbi:MAG TPA: hypothetical protein PLN91_00700 [Rhodanobacteraceae bacterium]|nr:hypothetical protein [Rhodanobacteraceae bacterium]
MIGNQKARRPAHVKAASAKTTAIAYAMYLGLFAAAMVVTVRSLERTGDIVATASPTSTVGLLANRTAAIDAAVEGMSR